MELFDKIYSCYYQVVTRILCQASDAPTTKEEMLRLINRYGYGESALTILPKLTEHEWPLLSEPNSNQYQSILKHRIKSPTTTLQKSWLRALLDDPRIRLFFTQKQLDTLTETLQNIAPLYSLSDFHYFDRCLDGDDYDSETYQSHFQTILTALREEHFLAVAYESPKSNTSRYHEVFPMQLQYSAKDDKFRLHGFVCFGRNRLQPIILNINRILACHSLKREKPSQLPTLPLAETETVLIEISNERNALERCMLHFASYKKRTEYDQQNNVYKCTIYYNKYDETELLIQLLSFGPVIRVLGPAAFLDLVKERVAKQQYLTSLILPV